MTWAFSNFWVVYCVNIRNNNSSELMEVRQKMEYLKLTQHTIYSWFLKQWHLFSILLQGIKIAVVWFKLVPLMKATCCDKKLFTVNACPLHFRIGPAKQFSILLDLLCFSDRIRVSTSFLFDSANLLFFFKLTFKKKGNFRLSIFLK